MLKPIGASIKFPIGESQGCHEVEPAFFDKLKAYKAAGNKEIQVKVEYTIDQSTNGGTKKKSP